MFAVLIPFEVIVSMYITITVWSSITQHRIIKEMYNPRNCIEAIVNNKAMQLLFLCFFLLLVLCVLVLIFNSSNKAYETELRKITDKISTPIQAGQKQHGSAQWMKDKEADKYFNTYLLKQEDLLKNTLPDIGGTVIGMKKKSKTKEKLYYIGDDVHTLCIGSTRSGKSRNVVLPTIGYMGLSGESMIISDPKGELYQYTYPFLESLGYEVITIDFKNPLKSSRYNFLQNVIDAVNEDNIPKAIDCAWDITSALVGKSKGERIWNDGEASVIASSILSVVYDNRTRPEYQNLTNVYHFIANMCHLNEKVMPLNRYMKTLNDKHPAKALIGISDVAPSRTRGSFFTSALTTLRLFTNPYIYAMTSASDFKLKYTGTKKRAIFMILPDEKSTYYSLASLFVSQQYELLVNAADSRGGGLERRVNFILDEFGNFTEIPSFANKLTVGAGRGIRFNLFVQSLTQIGEKYGRENASTIKGNCAIWIYLCADDNQTLDEISKRLGNYTVASSSKSMSYGKHSSGSSSTSINLTCRALLTPDEIRMIDRPYSLITSRNNPVIIKAPDLSKYMFNRLFGLGDKAHNNRVRAEQEEQRTERSKEQCDIKLWGIWNKFNSSSNYYHERKAGYVTADIE